MTIIFWQLYIEVNGYKVEKLNYNSCSQTVHSG